MLETLILDTVERLYSARGYLPARPKWHLMHATAAASPNKFTPAASCTYNEILDVFFWRTLEAGNPLVRFSPEAWLAGQPAVSYDTALSVSQLVVEQPTGRMWGVVMAGAGADGLYRRDASATVPNWTRVIGATNGASLRLYTKTNGEVWYNDATAGNWYMLSNGAAGSAQTVAPGGLYTSAGFSESFGNVDIFSGYDSYSLMARNVPLSNLLALTGKMNAEANVWQSPLAVFDNAAAPAANNLRCMLPSEWLLMSRPPNSLNASSQAADSKVLRLSATYSLLVLNTMVLDPSNNVTIYSGGSNIASQNAAGARYAASDGLPPRRVSLCLLNKQTWATKWLGVLPVPFYQEGSNMSQFKSEAWQFPTVAGARLKGQTLDLVFAGTVGYDHIGSVAHTGLMLASLPLDKLDI